MKRANMIEIESHPLYGPEADVAMLLQYGKNGMTRQHQRVNHSAMLHSSWFIVLTVVFIGFFILQQQAFQHSTSAGQ